MKTRWISCNACSADTYQMLSSIGEWNIDKHTIFMMPIERNARNI
jgi:hypothetical protein